MGFSPGSNLGSYEIVSLVGVGGMGEVYRARDTRLERIVAVKVLAPHLAASKEARERFEREARAVAALNHPNICTIHDVGEHGGQAFLVMEFLDGETLAERLKRGPILLEEGLGYAIDLADALDKAHRAGVVHRDYKTGNIIITKLGPKITDYGLAKFGAAARQGLDLSALPTAEKPLTEKGAILGTFQYMAPEQVEAKDTDARTDIFAFGAVLYEMLTGRRAFEGKSQASLIGAILKDDPPPISELQPLAPPLLERTVRRCLEKDPDERWQSAHDLHKELKWIADSGAQSGMATPEACVASGMWRRAVTVGLAALMGAFITGIIFRSLAPQDTRAVTRFTITLPPGEQLGNQLAFSPDGSELVYVGIQEGVRRLFRRSMDQLDASPIAGTEGGAAPFFSPDGEWLGFFADGKLNKVSLAGGPRVTLCEPGASRPGAGWGQDDTIIFSTFGLQGLMQVRGSGGEPQPITTLDSDQGEVGHWRPHILPGGKAVLFTVWYGSLGNAQIAVQSLGTEERKMLVAVHPYTA